MIGAEYVATERIEFVVKGPPVGANAKEHSTASRKKYRDWKAKISEAARSKLPTNWQISKSTVYVCINNYHGAGSYLDVDNVIKPIFDGMNGVVFEDDREVYKVISQRFNLSSEDVIPHPTELVVEALNRYAEFVQVIVELQREN